MNRNKKNLKRRTEKKIALKVVRTRQQDYNRSLKKIPAYNPTTRAMDFIAPLKFSFLTNPESTNDFFNSIISFISNPRNFGKKLFIDISRITELTIDALMYLLAIVNNLHKNFRNKFSFSGNTPYIASIKKLFTESGFYSYVKYQGTDSITRNSDLVQIVSGENSDTEIAKRISDFVSEKAGVSRKECDFIYVMMIELMSNTMKHAYHDGGMLYPRWYCYADYNKDDRMLSFTFMDTGDGIPSTVRKNFAEKLDFLKIFGENRYVTSALDGKFRTATKQLFRGKGLPKIREFCTNDKITNMRIITNKADVVVKNEGYDSREIHVPLQGTLYYWQISIANLKGV